MIELNKETQAKLVELPDTNGTTKTFLNTTGLETADAVKFHTILLEVLRRGEEYRNERIIREEEYHEFMHGSLWDEEDLKNFAALDITPYQFRDHRTIVNKMIARQRNKRFKFKVVTSDAESYVRHEAAFNEFYNENGSQFDSMTQAREYFEEVADDKYASAVSAYMHNVRYQNKAKYTESDCFHNGIIYGIHFLKAVYSTDVFTNGGITIKSVPARAMIFDESSTEYDLNDIEFIGEVKEMYVTQLIAEFPQHAREIHQLYKGATTTQDLRRDSKTYNRYRMDNTSNNGNAIKVCTLYTYNLEERIAVLDRQTGDERVADYGMTEAKIKEAVAVQMLKDQLAIIKRDAPEEFTPETLSNPELEAQIRGLVNERYEFKTTYVPIWYHSVFTHEALLVHQRSIYPHGSHPYARFSPDFSQGRYDSFLRDLKDIVIGLNKAVMFREIMLAHGAKNLVVVNKRALTESNLTEDDIKGAWTEIGGLIAFNLRPNQRIADVIMPVTSVSSNLAEVERIIASYDQKLRFISGISFEQLGQTQGETPTGRYKMQLLEGNENNGIVFDNFIRTMETFYNDKVVPLCVEDIKLRSTQVIRLIGDHHSPWINFDVDKTYGVFEESIRAGQYGTVIVPDEEDPQIRNTRSAQLMQLAMSTGNLDMYAMAVRFSDDPNRHEIVREIRNIAKSQQVANIQSQIDLQSVQKIMLENGVPAETAAEMVRKMQLERMRQLQSAQSQNPASQGAGAIQASAKETQRLQSIETGM